MHPIDYFFQHAGKVLRKHMQVVNVPSRGAICAVCMRPAEKWLEHDVLVDFEQYGLKEYHCTACHSLYEGSFELFGIERLAKGSPVPMKLGMLTGCAALITPRETILYLNGFIDKLSQAPS